MRAPCAGRLAWVFLLAAVLYAAGISPRVAAQTSPSDPRVDLTLEARLNRLEVQVGELSRKLLTPPPAPSSPPPLLHLLTKAGSFSSFSAYA